LAAFRDNRFVILVTSLPEIKLTGADCRCLHQEMGGLKYFMLALALTGADAAALQDDGPVRYRFPLQLSESSQAFGYGAVHDYFDHDPSGPGRLMDWSCGTRTYDRLAGGYDHAGTDYFLLPFPWDMLDAEEVEVVAVAAGEVVALRDGQYDRECSWNGAPGSPDYERRDNFVRLRHADGGFTHYGHLGNGLPEGIVIGAQIAEGDVLGTIATSGYTSYPHLHFEPWTPDGVAFDPYAGVCHAGETRWRHQPAYQNTVVNRIETHAEAPYIPTLGLQLCGQTDQEEYLADRFVPGDTVFIGVGLSDFYTSTRGRYEVLRPDGSVFATQDSQEPTPLYPAGRWNTGFYDVFSADLPAEAPSGAWRVRVDINNQIWERGFFVGIDPGETRLAAAVLPSSRSVYTGDINGSDVATVLATIVNAGSETAYACGVYPDRPVDGRLDFFVIDPGTQAVISDRNESFDIAPGSQRGLLLAFTPNYRSQAENWEMRYRVVCRNANRARQIDGVNSVSMSFGPVQAPDLIAIAATAGNNGIVELPDAQSAAAFAVAVANVGASGELMLRPQGLGAAEGLQLRICETDPGSGACLNAASSSIGRTFAANETASFAIFARAQGEDLVFAPARTRIRVVAEDPAGIVRGATSVAVRTPSP
jgi:murein DD-endopeptidase MepM/ murein hydrolase activator NlpD